MLSSVLLKHVFRLAAVLIGLAAIAAAGLFGWPAAVAVVVGGLIMVLDGAALVYLVGRLMDPTLPGAKKGIFTLILVLKLAIVAGILWTALTYLGSDGVGILLGLGAGLVALVLGVNQGSASAEGEEAIRDAEAKIAEEMGDNETEMR